MKILRTKVLPTKTSGVIKKAGGLLRAGIKRRLKKPSTIKRPAGVIQ